ncbi:MAG: acetamidase/formamidase family protein [Thermofilaceae archaeon]
MGLVRLDASRVFYRFDPDIPPAARARPGDLVEFECQDALGGQIVSEEQTVASIDWNRVNPATGPLYVEGTTPGDALAVKILSIELGGKGVVVTAPGEGALPHLTREARTRICRIYEDRVEFLGLALKARKMIGVIGTASSERAPTGVPGRHGGNLDTRLIGEGSTVYLPVEYEGGLLGIGDLHAVMGDGEVCVAACEVSGKVLARIGVLRGLAPKWPMVETRDATYLIISAEGLENALKLAVEEAVGALSRALNLDWYDAYMLASMALDFEISQVVDPRKTVRVRVPKEVVPATRLLESFARSRGR